MSGEEIFIPNAKGRILTPEKLFKRYWTMSRYVNEDGKDSLCPECGSVVNVLVEECNFEKKILIKRCVNDWKCKWEDLDIDTDRENEGDKL